MTQEPLRKRKRANRYGGGQTKSSFPAGSVPTVEDSGRVTRSKTKQHLASRAKMEVAAKTAIPADDKKRRVKSYISGTLEVLEGEVLATFEKTKVVAVVGSAEARDDSAAASMDRNGGPAPWTATTTECILRCDESPLAPSGRGGADKDNLQRGVPSCGAEIPEIQPGSHVRGDPQHRRTRRVVAPQGGATQPKPRRPATKEDAEDLGRSFRFLSDKDEETRPDPRYLQRHDSKVLPQEYINSNMRTICCGWMVELSLEFKFQQETLMLGIRIFDRFLSLSPEPVSRRHLQLVAIASMLLASKMEEVSHPSVKDFSKMSADTFSPNDVKRMEVSVLQTLQYRIHSPCVGSYVSIVKEATDMDGRTYHLAMYLIELCALHYAFLSYHPSLVASSAIHLSRMRPWTDELERVTGYHEKQLRECSNFVAKVHQLACEENKPDAPVTPLKEKYRMHSKLCVSNEKPLKTQL